MIRYQETLMEQAKAILSAHGTADEMQASQDVDQIDELLNQLLSNGMNPVVRQQATALDSHLREKYLIIDTLQNAANEIGRVSPYRASNNSKINDSLIHRLVMDRFGIWTNTLLKHRVIENLKDVLEDVPEQENPLTI